MEPFIWASPRHSGWCWNRVGFSWIKASAGLLPICHWICSLAWLCPNPDSQETWFPEERPILKGEHLLMLILLTKIKWSLMLYYGRIVPLFPQLFPSFGKKKKRMNEPQPGLAWLCHSSPLHRVIPLPFHHGSSGTSELQVIFFLG